MIQPIIDTPASSWNTTHEKDSKTTTGTNGQFQPTSSSKHHHPHVSGISMYISDQPSALYQPPANPQLLNSFQESGTFQPSEYWHKTIIYAYECIFIQSIHIRIAKIRALWTFIHMITYVSVCIYMYICVCVSWNSFSSFPSFWNMIQSGMNPCLRPQTITTDHIHLAPSQVYTSNCLVTPTKLPETNHKSKPHIAVFFWTPGLLNLTHEYQAYPNIRIEPSFHCNLNQHLNDI